MKGTDSLLYTGTYHKNLAIWKRKFLKFWKFGQFVPGIGINNFLIA
jgi:hypothetical protein